MTSFRNFAGKANGWRKFASRTLWPCTNLWKWRFDCSPWAGWRRSLCRRCAGRKDCPSCPRSAWRSYWWRSAAAWSSRCPTGQAETKSMTHTLSRRAFYKELLRIKHLEPQIMRTVIVLIKLFCTNNHIYFIAGVLKTWRRRGKCFWVNIPCIHLKTVRLAGETSPAKEMKFIQYRKMLGQRQCFAG